jgi:hypothetical protein
LMSKIVPEVIVFQATIISAAQDVNRNIHVVYRLNTYHLVK